MTPATLNLTLNPGVTFGPITFTFKDAVGDPIDLTNYNVWAWAKVSPDDLPYSVPLLDLTAAITDGAAGEITIQLTDEETFDIAEFEGFWDIILETPSPNKERIGPFVAGTFRVVNIVTKPYET